MRIISTIDAIAVSSPTPKNEHKTQPSGMKAVLDTISKQHAEAASAKALQASAKQELVVRIEICTSNRPINIKDLIVIPTHIIQAEKCLNADWLKRAVFILNTCHIWERVVFQGFDFPYLEKSNSQIPEECVAKLN